MDRSSRHNENYGRGVVEIEDASFTSDDEVVERLLTTFRSKGYKPPVLPRVGIELIALTRKANVTIPQIVALLEQDSLIAAEVLKLAQSAFYARGASIQSLHDAIVRLGLNTITDLFLESAASMKVFRAPGYEEPMNRLRRHSAAVAHISRLVARRTSLFDEYAFLCGLLHDAGIAASIVVLAEKKPGKNAAPLPPFEEVWPAIRAAHERAAEVLGNVWKLPPDVTRVISHHHQAKVDGVPHPLSQVIAIAEMIATNAGFGMEDEGPEDARAACSALGISDELYAELVKESKKVLERIA